MISRNSISKTIERGYRGQLFIRYNNGIITKDITKETQKLFLYVPSQGILTLNKKEEEQCLI